MTTATHKAHVYTDLLNSESWRRFLESLMRREYDPEVGGQPQVLVNGRAPSKPNKKRLDAWRSGQTPRLGTADRFCIDVGLHVEEFFLFCEKRHLSPWEVEPEWPF